jgi:hypothetical protein
VSTNLRIGVNPRESESVKAALEKLEDRFTRTMKEVADLTDEKQRLEHLVLQLQGETETIGKITLSFCDWLLETSIAFNFLKLNVIV